MGALRRAVVLDFFILMFEVYTVGAAMGIGTLVRRPVR
jgi:hypothetical protein